MPRSVMAAIFVVFASAAASASTAPVALETACEPGTLAAAPPCEVEGDVTALAAELLVVKFGSGAPEFAAVRATRYAAEDDTRSAKFWRGIAERATEMLKSRAEAEPSPTILSK